MTAIEGWYNQVVYTSVVLFIITINTWCISTSSFQIYIKLINKKVSNICLFFQSSILVNSHTFAWMFFIIQCCQDEVDDSDWWLFWLGGEDPDRYFLSAYTSEHYGEAIDGSDIVEFKFRLKDISRL